MSSAVSAGDLTLYRTHPQVANGYLWVDKPPIVYQGLVNQATAFTYPVDAPIPIDNETGTVADVQVDMLITFGTTAGGDDLGRTRVLGITADTVSIPRISQGTVDGTVKLSDNIHFTIWDTYPPAPKFPFYDEANQVFYKDGIRVFVAATPPIINIGYAHIYADLVNSSDKLVLTIDSTDSFSPVGGTLTRLWDVEDGTITSGSTSSTAITVEFPVGRRWIKLSLTDTTNSVATIRHLLIVACKLGDATYAPIVDAKASTLSQTIEGLRQSFTFGQDIAAITYLDGVAVCYFQREFYGTTEDALHDATPVKFAGWHRADSARIQAQQTHLLTEVTLDCIDTAGVLAQLPGFPQTLESASSPTRWEEMASPNLDKFLAYLWVHHSTAPSLVDFTWSGTTTTYPFVRLNALGNSLYGQIDGRARAIGYRLLSNVKGRCKVKKDSMLFDSGSRDSVNVISLTESDIVSISYTHQRPPRSHWNRGNAVVASSSAVNAVFCIAPGIVPSWGLSSGEIGENLVASQTELNARVGHASARENARRSYVEVELLHAGDLGLEPLDFIRITLSSDYAAQRGLTWTTQRFAVVAINTDYDPVYGTKRVRLTLEEEVFGSAAETVTPPNNPLPDFNLATDLYPPDDTFQDAPLNNAATIAMSEGGKLLLTLDITATPPVYRDITGTGLSGAFTLGDFRVDPFCDLATTGSGSLKAYMFTRAGIFYGELTDLQTDSFVWTQKQAIALDSLGVAQIRTSINTSGVIYVAYGDSTLNTLRVRRYSANGDTQTWTVDIGTYNFGQPGMDIDLYGSDEVLVCAHTGTVGSGNSYVYRVVGGVASQLANTGIADAGGQAATFKVIQKPFKTPAGALNNNTGSTEYFVYSTGFADDAQSPRKLKKTTDGGTTITDVTPSGSNYNLTVRDASPVFVSDGNVYTLVDNQTGRVFTSIDAGSNWTDRGLAFGSSTVTVSSGYLPLLVQGQYVLYIGASNLIYYSPDWGATWFDKTGNAASLASGLFSRVVPLYRSA